MPKRRLNLGEVENSCCMRMRPDPFTESGIRHDILSRGQEYHHCVASSAARSRETEQLTGGNRNPIISYQPGRFTCLLPQGLGTALSWFTMSQTRRKWSIEGLLILTRRAATNRISLAIRQRLVCRRRAWTTVSYTDSMTLQTDLC